MTSPNHARAKKRIRGIPCLPRMQAGMTFPPTNISCNNQNIGCDLPQLGSDHQSKHQLDYRDLINHHDKCPRTILKELGSLNLLRIRCDGAQ